MEIKEISKKMLEKSENMVRSNLPNMMIIGYNMAVADLLKTIYELEFPKEPPFEHDGYLK